MDRDPRLILRQMESAQARISGDIDGIQEHIRSITDVSFGVYDAFVDALSVQSQFTHAVLSYLQTELSEEQMEKCGRYLSQVLFGSQVQAQGSVAPKEGDPQAQCAAEAAQQESVSVLQAPAEASENDEPHWQKGELGVVADHSPQKRPKKPNKQGQQEQQQQCNPQEDKPPVQETVAEYLSKACSKLADKAERFCSSESRSSEAQRKLLQFADLLNGQICRSELQILEKQVLWQELEAVIDKLK